MQVKCQKPRKALNKAYLKLKPNRKDVERFKDNLIQLLERCNEAESEEFHKNLVTDFLKKTWYDSEHYINTKGRNDLVIHNGNNSGSPVGVIIEAKKPGKRAEMLSPEKINVKAFHELLLYYLRERITLKNLNIRHLAATNIFEWFIFDGGLFEKLFAQNKALVKQFTDFEQGRLSGKTTDFFYKEIAEPFVQSLEQEIELTYFDFRDFEKIVRNQDRKDDVKLIALFKLLSPEHLLKLPFANDSNTLDKRFFSELLHIIGLEETKEGSKKLIGRAREGHRNSASIIEDVIIQLESLDKMQRLNKPGEYGETHVERLFNVALELSITWINRLLFLKLLEAQLVAYHKGDKEYSFLNHDKIKSYDDLNTLFFQVLARRKEERNADVRPFFEKVPYLNSSLFEPTELEHTTLLVSNLRDDKFLPILANTVLKDQQGKKRSGSLPTLTYLFEFLDAYDFSSEGSEEIQEDNKTLINASVLGLIFEKINGYRDGSFFTPGFVTMFMSRETIRRAVIQKFNDVKGWECENLDQLYNKIDNQQEANAIVNSLKICDPAVGSGHFLVSALNEIIAIKNNLHILQDRQGRRLKEYQVEVVNDELIVTDEDGRLFEYNPMSRESQRVQEALFHEKLTVIENCLFGVDINPNSVKICRLRLWIELLKNAYYINETGLETLPNIDINIKRGNSLVSRFALDADLKAALRKSKYSISAYRISIETYRNAENREQKWEMRRLIEEIKSNFEKEVFPNSPIQKQIDKLGYELFLMTGKSKFGTGLMMDFEENDGSGKDQKLKKEREKRTKKIEGQVEQLYEKREEIENSVIFNDAFEWRFEFPEVLNEEGKFIGFDIVIGNPPYIRQEELKTQKAFFKEYYKVFDGTADLYVYFVELGLNLLRPGGEFIFILPNKWMRAGYGKNLRRFISRYRIQQVVDFGDLPVFDEATTYPCIMHLVKSSPAGTFRAANIKSLDFPLGLPAYVQENTVEVNAGELQESGWTLAAGKVQELLAKIKQRGRPLGDYVNGIIFYGIKTGLNEAFVIDQATRDRLIADDPRSAEIIKPFLAGRDIKRYQQPKSDKYLIFIQRGLKIDDYPGVHRHLLNFKQKLEKKAGTNKWFELQASPGDFRKFEEVKIMYPDISKNLNFILDTEGHYSVNTVYNIGSDSKGLLGFLNSKLFLFYFQTISNSIRGGYLRFFTEYMKDCPVLNGLEKLEPFVEKILEIKKLDPASDTSELELEIDKMVFEMFNLTEEEIELIEFV
ncbi:MAG: TaqI-like C-terminal specificity domain-containing protein [Bacteroidales bacterium]|jgi:hypothetical protein|nr:TaqI-like C-terminal specificity domain-containing protein [Bacteroidales bacterium]